MKKSLLAIILAALMAFGVCGCAKEAEVEDAVVTETPTPTPTATPTPTPTPEPLKTIGVESTADTVFCVTLKNSTGLDITGVSVKLMEEEEFPENMLAEGDVFVVDEERNLFYDSAAAVEEEISEEADSDEKLLEPGYDIQITFADETVKVLHAFPFGDIEVGELCLEEEIAFVKYTNVSAGEVVSTKEAEIAVKESEEAAAKAAAEAQAAAERAAAERAAAEAAARAEAERQQAAQNQSAPEAPSQDSESCLGDDALTW